MRIQYIEVYQSTDKKIIVPVKIYGKGEQEEVLSPPESKLKKIIKYILDVTFSFRPNR
jgi:hypothetical protein